MAGPAPSIPVRVIDGMHSRNPSRSSSASGRYHDGLDAAGRIACRSFMFDHDTTTDCRRTCAAGVYPPAHI